MKIQALFNPATWADTLIKIIWVEWIFIIVTQFTHEVNPGTLASIPNCCRSCFIYLFLFILINCCYYIFVLGTLFENTEIRSVSHICNTCHQIWKSSDFRLLVKDTRETNDKIK